MLYGITAQIEHTDDDGRHGSTGVPSFILDSDIQGITSAAHARRIAYDVIDPGRFRRMRGDLLHVTVVAL